MANKAVKWVRRQIDRHLYHEDRARIAIALTNDIEDKFNLGLNGKLPDEYIKAIIQVMEERGI